MLNKSSGDVTSPKESTYIIVVNVEASVFDLAFAFEPMLSHPRMVRSFEQIAHLGRAELLASLGELYMRDEGIGRICAVAQQLFLLIRQRRRRSEYLRRGREEGQEVFS